MSWKEVKQELLEYGYQEGQEYLVTKEDEDELILVVEGKLGDLEDFCNILEEYDLAAEATSARIIVTRNNQEERK